MMKTKKLKSGILVVLALLFSLVLTMVAFAGWETDGNKQWRYRNEDGTYLTSALTPDGYYVDSNGIWQESYTILGAEIKAKNYFLLSSNETVFDAFLPTLEKMTVTLKEETGGKRGFYVRNDRVEYVGLSDKTEIPLLYLSKDKESAGYRLEISCRLTKNDVPEKKLSQYDYQVLRGLLNMVSRSGELLSDAVYSSWEDSNSYGISMEDWVTVGDAKIRYLAVNGAGIYEIAAADGVSAGISQH